MNKKAIITFTIAVIVLVGGYFLLIGNIQAPVLQENNTQTEESMDKIENSGIREEDTATQQESTHEIVYTDNGYSPSELKIKVGDTVVFKNQGPGGVWTASAIHPSHTVYGGTSLQTHCPDLENDDFDECQSAQPGESWSFTFKKAGTWGYHNHVMPTHFGKVIVE